MVWHFIGIFAFIVIYNLWRYIHEDEKESTGNCQVLAGEEENKEQLNDMEENSNTKELATLRRYLDDVHGGKKRDEVLEPYKQELGGKFVVWSVEPYLAGGLLINFIFVDWPEKILTSSVYSFVDEDMKTVTGYTVLSVMIDEETKTELTKEEILNIVAEHPELKLW